MSSLFEKASRLKLRFETPKGGITVEDLWDCPLTSTTGRVNLDDLAQGLFKQLRDNPSVSFVVKETKNNDLTQLKFDIVKYIIDTRLIENKANDDAQANRAKKQQLLAILDRKQNADLENLPVEELQKLINSL